MQEKNIRETKEGEKRMDGMKKRQEEKGWNEKEGGRKENEEKENRENGKKAKK